MKCLFTHAAILLSLYCHAQSSNVDSIYVSHGTYVHTKSIIDIDPDKVKAGDTIIAFKVTEDISVRVGLQPSVVITKGASVRVVVRIAEGLNTLGHKGKKKPDGPGHKVGGELTIDLLDVQAIDSSYILLGDCDIIQYGGDNGGRKVSENATIRAGTVKICQTRYPGVKITARHVD